MDNIVESRSNSASLSLSMMPSSPDKGALLFCKDVFVLTGFVARICGIRLL